MTKKYTVHEGVDYVAVLAPEDNTENPTARFRTAADANKFVKAINAYADLTGACRSAHRSAVPLDDEGTAFSISRAAMQKITSILVKLDQLKSRGLPGSKHDGGAR